MTRDSEEPLIYSLKNSKMIVGSGNSCDIIIPDISVSRKHLIIELEDDHYFVTDQGSTNGTFINEERLVPGRRIEFTSFFPVRLGADVLISLLSDNDLLQNTPVAKALDNESTRVVSLKDLKSAKTQTLVNKRNETKTKKSAPKKNDPNTRMNIVKVFLVLMISAAIYYTYIQEPPPPPPVIAQVGQVSKVAVAPEVEAPKALVKLIDPMDLTPKEAFDVYLGDIKCTTDAEKYLCDLYPGAKEPWGVYQRGTMLNIMVDGKPYFNEARKWIPAPVGTIETPVSPEMLKDYENKMHELAGMLAIFRGIPFNFEAEKLQGLKITIALYEVVGEEKKVRTAVAFLPEVIPEFKKLINEDHVKNFRTIGLSSLTLAKEFYRIY